MKYITRNTTMIQRNSVRVKYTILVANTLLDLTKAVSDGLAYDRQRLDDLELQVYIKED